MVVAYGDNVNLKDGGWTVQGNGGGASKASFNLLGGYVEFDVDVSGVRAGVNANLYAIAPSIGADGYQPEEYCDGAGERPWCIELDWLESNGHCAGASTIHTVPGPGDNGCTAWGCRTHYNHGSPTFHMRVEYGSDGRETIFKDGSPLTGYSPNPDGSTWSKIQQEMQSKGVILYGSEWTGWVPDEWCGGPNAGDLEASTYNINNIVVQGSVVQGPEPAKCDSPAPVPVPTPAPTPVPVPPPPTPSSACSCGCEGSDLEACVRACPSDAYSQCVTTCTSPCSSSCTGGDDGSSLSSCVGSCPSDNFAACVSCCTDKFPSIQV